MIRFSAFLVVVAVGLLIAGVVTSKLWLVYIAIGVSGVALLALGIGAAVNWRELTGKTAETSAQGPAAQAAAPEAATSQAQPSQVPVPAGSAPSALSAPSGPSWPGYLPATESPGPKPEPRPGAQPPGSRPDDVPRAPAAFTPRRESPTAGVWEFRDNTIQVPPPSGPAAEPAASRKPAQSAAPPTSPQPVVKPVPPRDEDIAEPSPPAGRDQPSAKEQPSAREQSPADARDEGKPVTTSEPEPASEAEPVPDADPACEPELTLVPGATVAASAAASAPPTSQAERPEQDKQAAEAEPAGPDPTMEVTVAPGVPRYHNAHCSLIRFMGDSDLDKMTLAAAREIGCTPCRACLPDQPEGSPE